jgi:hypothetical protein
MLVNETKVHGYHCNLDECASFAREYDSWLPAHYRDLEAEVPVVLAKTEPSADLKEAITAACAAEAFSLAGPPPIGRCYLSVGEVPRSHSGKPSP